MVRSPTPAMTAAPAIIRVTGLVRSTRAAAQIRTPTIAISPTVASPIPPTTPGGMVSMSAVTYGTNASSTAQTAAIAHAAVENTLVPTINPVLAGYAVVPAPPAA